MKKRRTLVLVAGLIALLAIAIPVLAAPPGNWVTDFSLVNLSNVSTANISILRYDECVGACSADPGTVVATATVTPGGSYYYNPVLDPGFPSSYSGAIVVSSDQPLAGTITLANDLTGSSYASDAYSAVTTTSTSSFLPIVMAQLGGNNWNTRITVQNAGGSAADITIDYIGAGAPSDTVITGLPPNMMAMVDQYDLGITNFNGSASVTSTEPVAIVVEEYKAGGGVLVTYNGVPLSSADTTVYMPGYIATGFWATDFTISNTTGSTANITIDFSGSSSSLSGTIAGNSSEYFNPFLGVYPGGWTGSAPTVGYYGAATIASDQNIVAVYNIANSAGGGPGNSAIGYIGFPSSGADTTVIVPLIMHAYSTGWNTTFSVQNVQGGTANLDIYYSGNLAPNCSPCNYNMTTESHTFNQTTDGHVPAGFIGGVRIVSDKIIVVIADQNNTAAPAYIGGDAAAGFPGFPLP